MVIITTNWAHCTSDNLGIGMNHARMSTFITHLISLPTRVCSKLFTLSNILHLIWGTFSNVPQFSLLPHESLSLYHDTRWRSVFVLVKQQKRLTYLFITCRTTEMKIAHTLNVLDNKLLLHDFHSRCKTVWRILTQLPSFGTNTSSYIFP